jgi:2-keto-4-pentenoate hydratase/2-oxohepta-3-ene-1,7-dioic acid hydratase in catechol pathway
MMKILRFTLEGRIHWGILEEPDTVCALKGDLYGEFAKGERLCHLSDVELLAPAEPTIMVACGMNYRARLADRGWEEPVEPIIFFKPATAVIGPGDTVVFPAIATEMRYEAELCVVMKRRARNVAEKDAMNYILGYTCGNELGAMDLVKKDRWMTRAKGFDGSGPLGPFLVTGIDPHNLTIRSWVNGELKQDGHTSLMIFSVPRLVSFISGFMTLRSGDVIWTGTPPGVCNVQAGDAMDIEIEGIGVLRNTVVGPS